MDIQAEELFNGRYRLLSEKGRGAFGDVWLAHDEQTDLDVAIKIYIVLDNRGIDEFKSEYKNAYTLNHPNLLHAYHFDVVDNRPFLVMPYCPGSAESLIGCTDESIIWRFIRDVASGLAYLHSKNILHRDIKPDNILSDSEGNFLITDFGVSTKMKSTLRRNSTRMNNSGDISGTVGYMAPELFTKSPEAVKATDIWAFGVTLYEIINGELPFFGQGGIMLERGAEVPELKGSWSEGLKQTVESCLAKDTWNRPTSSQLAAYASKCVQGDIEQIPWKPILPKHPKEEQKTIRETTKPSNATGSGASEQKQTNKKKTGKTDINRSGNRRKKGDSWIASFVWCFIAAASTVIIIVFIGKENGDSVVAKPTAGKAIVESSANIKKDQSSGGVDIHSKEATSESNHVLSSQENTVGKTTDSEESSQEKKLQSAIRAGNYSSVRQMADNGYAPAYLPLAQHYLKTPSTHNLADKYARKAKAAGIKGAGSIIDDLDAMGYYD